MTVNQDPDLHNWIWGLVECKPTRPGSFLAALGDAAVRADEANYELLRPALLAIKAKYPKYHAPGDRDLDTGNHERDLGGCGAK
jgi:hypothetical protein